jgi:hypothetical protein
VTANPLMQNNSDVKSGFLNIVDKPHLKWHPKHWHIRRIPIPQEPTNFTNSGEGQTVTIWKIGSKPSAR